MTGKYCGEPTPASAVPAGHKLSAWPVCFLEPGHEGPHADYVFAPCPSVRVTWGP